MDIAKRNFNNSLRLEGYDYSLRGAYFFTICTDNRACYFGNIVDGIMISFPTSEIVREIWLEIPEKFLDVELDAFIIMPNHVHGIIIINKEWRGLIRQDYRNNDINWGKDLIYQTPNDDFKRKQKADLVNQATAVNQTKANDWAGLRIDDDGKDLILMKSSKRTIDKIIRYFKAKSTKFIDDGACHHFKWQPNHDQHIVRSRKELDAIREYILNNPLRWMFDRENRMSLNFNMNLDEYFRDVFEK